MKISRIRCRVCLFQPSTDIAIVARCKYLWLLKFESLEWWHRDSCTPNDIYNILDRGQIWSIWSHVIRNQINGSNIPIFKNDFVKLLMTKVRFICSDHLSVFVPPFNYCMHSLCIQLKILDFVVESLAVECSPDRTLQSTCWAIFCTKFLQLMCHFPGFTMPSWMKCFCYHSCPIFNLTSRGTPLEQVWGFTSFHHCFYIICKHNVANPHKLSIKFFKTMEFVPMSFMSSVE